jgi:hypothetical protein
MATKDTILESLAGGPKTVAQLVEATGKSDSTVRTAVKELVEDGIAAGPENRQYTLVGQSDNGDKPKRKNHGYARNTSTDLKANIRDTEVIEFLTELDGEATLDEIADGTSAPTRRAAQHAVWRLRRGDEPRVVKVGRKHYALAE